MGDMSDEAPRPEAEARALRRLQSAMSEAETALGRRMRMHPTDLAAMNHLTWATPPIGPGELGHRLGLSPAAATELVDRLTAAGHVERHRDLADRRRIRLQPSGDAVASVLGHIDTLIAAIEAVARDATDEERATILRFLQRVTTVYEDWADPERD
jgi:DNA-binding MarR family transcriptional regulator